ncbi:PDZ domain-containing protein [bacterium]|nr:PDZ domain-containing protein [bacterium]
MNRKLTYALIVTFLLLLMFSSFLMGFIVRGALTGSPIRLAQEPSADLGISLQPVETIWRVLRLIKENYVEKITDDTPLVYGAIRGMLGSLNDPYSRFLDPKQNKMLQEESSGEFYGIGAQLGLKRIEVNGKWEDRVAIIAPLPGSPAERAGLKAGDYIVAVDDKDVKGLSVDEVASKIRGKKGTSVKITVERRGVKGTLTFTIQRELIRVEPVESKLLPGGIGYIKLQSFSENAGEVLKETVEKLEKQGARGLIVDVRNNPGGLFDEAVKTASVFVQESPIVIIQERGGKRTPIDPDRKLGTNENIPLVVLINEGSASASEIFAGAIKDHERGKLVGRRTFGKGLVQTVIPLGDGSAIALTTAKYLTPSGKDINKEGIQPDITFGPDESKYEFIWNGAILRWENKHLRILYLSSDSPLAKAGFQENDLIVQIDDKVVSVNSLVNITNLLFDDTRTTATLKVSRNGKVLSKSVSKQDIDIQLEKATEVVKKLIK